MDFIRATNQKLGTKISLQELDISDDVYEFIYTMKDEEDTEKVRKALKEKLNIDLPVEKIQEIQSYIFRGLKIGSQKKKVNNSIVMEVQFNGEPAKFVQQSDMGWTVVAIYQTSDGKYIWTTPYIISTKVKTMSNDKFETIEQAYSDADQELEKQLNASKTNSQKINAAYTKAQISPELQGLFEGILEAMVENTRGREPPIEYEKIVDEHLAEDKSIDDETKKILRPYLIDGLKEKIGMTKKMKATKRREALKLALREIQGAKQAIKLETGSLVNDNTEPTITQQYRYRDANVLIYKAEDGSYSWQIGQNRDSTKYVSVQETLMSAMAWYDQHTLSREDNNSNYLPKPRVDQQKVSAQARGDHRTQMMAAPKIHLSEVTDTIIEQLRARNPNFMSDYGVDILLIYDENTLRLGRPRKGNIDIIYNPKSDDYSIRFVLANVMTGEIQEDRIDGIYFDRLDDVIKGMIEKHKGEKVEYAKDESAKPEAQFEKKDLNLATSREDFLRSLDSIKDILNSYSFESGSIEESNRDAIVSYIEKAKRSIKEERFDLSTIKMSKCGCGKHVLHLERMQKVSLATRGAKKVMKISDEIMNKYGLNSGTQMAQEPQKSEFLQRVKDEVGQLEQSDGDSLENENFHTELKLLAGEGLITGWGIDEEGFTTYTYNSKNSVKLQELPEQNTQIDRPRYKPNTIVKVKDSEFRHKIISEAVYSNEAEAYVYKALVLDASKDPNFQEVALYEYQILNEITLNKKPCPCTAQKVKSAISIKSLDTEAIKKALDDAAKASSDVEDFKRRVKEEFTGLDQIGLKTYLFQIGYMYDILDDNLYGYYQDYQKLNFTKLNKQRVKLQTEARYKVGDKVKSLSGRVLEITEAPFYVQSEESYAYTAKDENGELYRIYEKNIADEANMSKKRAVKLQDRYTEADGQFKSMTCPDNPSEESRFCGCVRKMMADGYPMENAKRICGSIKAKMG